MSLLSAPIAAASSALFFALSFLSIRRIRRPESLPDRPEHPHPPRVWRRIHEGLRFVARSTALRTVCLASAAFQFSFAATMTVYLLFLPRELPLSGTVVGLALAAAGPGAPLGSLPAARLPGRFGHGAVLVGAAALGDGVFLWVPALHGSSAATVAALLAVGFVFGLGGQLVNVTVMAVRQAVTPDGMQGRAAAPITFVGGGGDPARFPARRTPRGGVGAAHKSPGDGGRHAAVPGDHGAVPTRPPGTRASGRARRAAGT